MNAEKTLADVGLLTIVKKPDGRKGRVFRKKRGKIDSNQKKDLIKDIRGLLRVEWDSETVDLDKLKQIKALLEAQTESN